MRLTSLILGLLASGASAFFLAPTPFHHHSSHSTGVENGAVAITRVRLGAMCRMHFCV